VEERFILLSANDPSNVDWTLSLLHFAKVAEIARVLQLRGLQVSQPGLREIVRECKATGVRLDVLGDPPAHISEAVKAQDGSFVIAAGVHAWTEGSNTVWGGKTVALLGSSASIPDSTVLRVAQQLPGGADVVLRGMALDRNEDDETMIRSQEHVWRILRQLRPLLYVHATVGARHDSVETVDGRTVLQCGLSQSGGASVAVLDLRSLQVLG
jgi:hypothetical protein